MASIDERVVQMTFKGAGFVSGANQVLSALQALKDKLGGLKGAESALNGLNVAGKKVDLSGIESGVDKIVSKFTALKMAAVAALATIVSQAVMTGGRLVKALTIDPVIAGFREYETKLNSIQTILANTTGQADSNIQTVTRYLDELNKYADLTIYSFAEMARNIGMFTAAGVGLKDSVASIKGLANLAALSGSTSQQASTAMYQLSQAISAGTIRLMDWNSVVNAGMGGKVFQNLLIETARVNGVAIDAMIKKNGSFRQSLQEGWLTADIMTQTLSLLTGDLSKQQIMAMGFTEKQTAAIMKQAQAAVDSATKVRTLTQLWSAVSESVSSAWARVWEALVGNLPQATKLLTGVMNVLTGMFSKPINDLADFLQLWNEIGGRQVLIDALSKAFRILGSVLKPIGDAFRDVFPPMTVTTLMQMTVAFARFIDRIKVSSETITNLHNTFEGLFSVIKIVWDVVSGVVGVIFRLIGAASGAGGGILSLTGRFGKFLTGIRKAIESGEGLSNFFRKLGDILTIPVKALGYVVKGLDLLAEGAEKALNALKPFFSWVGKEFAKLGSVIAEALTSGDFSNVMNVLNQGLFAAILLAIRNFVKNLGKSANVSGGGIFASIKNAISSLTGALQAMQANLKADTLRKLAIAIGVITASIVALSFVDAGKLSKSLAAITTMFVQLLAAMSVVGKISNTVGVVKMAAVSGALNMLASAVVILSGAVAILSRFSWEELARGISAVGLMLGILVTAANLMGKDASGVIAGAFAMTVMAVALNLLALAVGRLGRMDWATLGKGVGTIAALLLIMGAFNKFGGTQIIKTAASMLILGAALNVIANAMKILGSMSLSEIGKGLLAVAGALVIISFGMSLMPKNMLLTAAGLLVVSSALTILSKALASMGGMFWSEVAKSLIMLAGALVIIAGAMWLMQGALPGAAALLIISAALGMLTPILIVLGSLPWSVLLTSLAALAGIFLVLGLSGLLLAPLVPVLMALGVALMLFGTAVLAVGTGIFLVGAGLTAIGIAVTASGAAIATFVKGLLDLIPLAMAKIGEGIVAFANVIARSGVAITKAFTSVLTALLNSIIKVMPLIGKAISAILDVILKLIVKYTPQIVRVFINLLNALLNAISANMPKFVQKGADILVKFLNGIASNLGRVITAGTNVVIAFIRGVGNSASRVAQAGVDTIIKFVNATAAQIRNSGGQLGDAAWNLAASIVQGLVNGLWAFAQNAINAAASIGRSMFNAIAQFFNPFGSPSIPMVRLGEAISDGLTVGLRNAMPNTVKAADRTGKAIFTALKQAVDGANSMLIDTMDLQPRITPVVDLTQARRGFSDLAALADVKARASLASASYIFIPGRQPPAETEIAAVAGTRVSFIQNNTSPKALSAAEIYRQTRNQLSVMRGALPA